MSSRYSEIDNAERPRRSLVTLFVLAFLAFAAGLAAMVWLLAQWPAAAELVGVKPPPPPPAALVPAPPLPAPAAETPVQGPQVDAELNRRVDLLEQRIGTIDTQAR